MWILSTTSYFSSDISVTLIAVKFSSWICLVDVACSFSLDVNAHHSRFVVFFRSLFLIFLYYIYLSNPLCRITLLYLQDQLRLINVVRLTSTRAALSSPSLVTFLGLKCTFLLSRVWIVLIFTYLKSKLDEVIDSSFLSMHIPIDAGS